MIQSSHLEDFILAHRRNKVFRDMTREQIRAKIADTIVRARFFYTKENSQITGVIVLGNVDALHKTIFIEQLLCLTKKSLKEMLNTFDQMFPCYTIRAMRKGELVEYKSQTNRLCHLLKLISA